MPPEARHVDWSDAEGTLSFGLGMCRLYAGTTELTLHLEASDEESLGRLQDLVAHRLQTIASRDALRVEWRRVTAP